MTWHASTDVLTRYSARPEALDDATASSIEMHLMQCEECRSTLAAAAPLAAIADSWAAIADRIDAPRVGVIERVMIRLGVSPTSARLVAATRGLQLSWLASLALIVGGVVLMSLEGDDPAPFLFVAPIVPVGAVALAFAAGGEPAGESAGATPLAGVGLALRRTVAVLVASLIALALGALVVADVGLHAAVWVLPSLALSAAALALATWVRVEVAATALAVTWLSVFVTARSLAPRRTPVLDLALFTAAGQLATALAFAVCLAVLAMRRDAFATLGRIR